LRDHFLKEMQDGVIDSFFRMEQKEHEDEVFKTSMQNSVHALDNYNLDQVGVVGVEPKLTENHLINHGDSTIGVTLKDDPNKAEDRDS